MSRVAAELGVCWWTVMNAVIEHGTPLVGDPERVGAVRSLGVDETTFLSANRLHSIIYATGLVDLEAKVLIDLVEGNAAADLAAMAKERPQAVARGHRGGGHRPGRVVPSRTVAAALPRPPGGESLPRRPCRQPVPGQGAPTGPERDARPSRPQGRSALPDPQAVGLGCRAPRRAGLEPDAPGPARRRSPRRGPGRVAGEGVGSPSISRRTRRWRRPCSTRSSPAAPPTTSRRSAHSATHSSPVGRRSSPTTTAVHRTGPPRGLTCASNASSAAATASSGSSTTASASSFTPEVSAGPAVPGRLGSEPALPSQTRSATVCRASFVSGRQSVHSTQ